MDTIWRKINETLTKSERDRLNRIRGTLFAGIDCFNQPHDNLSHLEKEGLEQIREALSMFPVLSLDENGEPMEMYFSS